MNIPEWFGPMLMAARHQDEMRKWPWWARLLHRYLIRCPACKYWRKK